ncbi:hypothetical protein BH24ACT19_BH24ACT19_11110 [soil metagenome]
MVRDSDGDIISRSPLPGSGDFQIEYVHSYYDAPAIEHFTAGEDGDFELVGVSSPSEAVLDYYELEGRKEIEGELLHLVPDEPQELEALPLIGTWRGGRTLVVSGERFPLYSEGGARHLVVEVERDTFGIEPRRMVGGLRPEESWQAEVLTD